MKSEKLYLKAAIPIAVDYEIRAKEMERSFKEWAWVRHQGYELAVRPIHEDVPSYDDLDRQAKDHIYEEWVKEQT